VIWWSCEHDELGGAAMWAASAVGEGATAAVLLGVRLNDGESEQEKYGSERVRATAAAPPFSPPSCLTSGADVGVRPLGGVRGLAPVGHDLASSNRQRPIQSWRGRLTTQL
jgi:hypothetical protein